MTSNSLAWDHPAPFTQRFDVLPHHIDALEHTNNAVYVNWCMEVAWGTYKLTGSWRQRVSSNRSRYGTDSSGI